MKIIIAGTRTFTDYPLLCRKCDAILANIAVAEIVSGTANGADKLGERYAAERGCRVGRFPADWGKYGKSAGVLRNRQMAEYADGLIAFWDGKSRGTANMIEVARARGLRVRVVRYELL